MLVNLHVKNFAIIDEIDIDFNKNLNILTGETGAGKSILVGSINIALGARVSADMIRKGADYAMVSLVFLIEKEENLKALQELDIYPEDGEIVISRKIMENRTVNKINGESVTVATIRKVAEICIDIHGQHEHQSLLKKERHIEIVDDFKREELAPLKAKLLEQYKIYTGIQKELEETQIPEDERSRQLSFLQYERDEIEKANLAEGEEEELEARFRKLSNGESIVDALGKVYQFTSDEAGGASSQVGYALRELQNIAEIDEDMSGFLDEMTDIENLLSDFNREVSEYMSDFSFDESEYNEVGNRLEEVRHIYDRYGGSYEGVMEHLTQVKEKLSKYEDYDEYVAQKTMELQAISKEMKEIADSITAIRREGSNVLQTRIMAALEDLNFESTRFEICMTTKESVGSKGQDDLEFMISTNPGEDLKPLEKIASGGELSRIMLAIKSVFADRDSIETLIFDEIDVGISGRTAQKVSEKMAMLGKEHQIICITHLAQIAAMADTHYLIEKSVHEGKTQTMIYPLKGEDPVKELARILGGAKITEAVMESASEMKKLANAIKEKM